MGDHDDDEALRTRRSAEARTPVSDPVRFQQGDRTIEGWALNISASGLRVVLDEPVRPGEVFEVAVGEAPPRPARVVWVREERGGAIVGAAFEDVDGASAPPDED